MTGWKHKLLKAAAAALAACLLLAALPIAALADVDPDYELYSTAGGFLRVNRYTGVLKDGVRLSGDLVIPREVEGVTVTAIDNRAFYGCEELTSVVIPSTVSSIGDSAFYGCRQLQSLTVPGSVKSIGNNAFTYCDALKSVTLEEGVETMGTAAFRYCYGLRSVSLPSTLKAVEDYAFAACLALESLTISNGVQSLGESAFSGCVNLKTVSIPNSVVSIGDNCFNGCTALESASLPTGITVIPIGMFDGCSALKQLVVPDGVQRIESLAFRNCKSLARLSLPDSVTSFPANAFTGCGDDLTFYVNAGSFAQAFAASAHIPFVLGTLTPDDPADPGNYSPTPFTDDKSHWARKSIEWAYAKGYIMGTTPQTFSPQSTLNRAMLVTILYRMEGSPSVSGGSGFTDVPGNAYYANAAIWAEQNGIVTGVGSNRFAPTQNITREQLATMLYRYARYKGKNTAVQGNMNQFRDTASIGNFAGAAMSWAVGTGIITGNERAELSPKGNATRAEAAVMLQRFDNLS